MPAPNLTRPWPVCEGEYRKGFSDMLRSRLPGSRSPIVLDTRNGPNNRISVVLSRDILSVAVEEIPETRVEMTIVGGEVRYER